MTNNFNQESEKNMDYATCEQTLCGVFVAKRQGCCIRISIPAQTCNDWENKNQFMDLPMMDDDTLDNFIKTLQKIREDHSNLETT